MKITKPSQATRGYLYRVLTAAVPIATVYGIVQDSTAALWLALGAAVLGTGTAAANTPTR